MRKKNIAFISGISDNNQITVLGFQRNGALSYVLNGTSNVGNFLHNDLFNRLFITLDTLDQQQIALDNIDVVFNQISDPDTHKISLLKVDSLYASYGKKIPFFNTPANVRKTSRDNIYKLLHGIKKLTVPKTVRIQPRSASDIYSAIKKEKLKFPVILRKAGDHGGISTILIENENEQFYAFPLDGQDYYLTQFVDYADNGTYAKYRLIVVKGKVYLRHVIFSDHWMVHGRTQLDESRVMKQEISKRFTKEIKPSIQPTISKIHHSLGLEYFGIDCHIDHNMNILVFEINANMNVFIETEGSVFKKHVEMARKALIKILAN